VTTLRATRAQTVGDARVAEHPAAAERGHVSVVVDDERQAPTPPHRRRFSRRDALAVGGRGLTVFGVLVLGFTVYLVGASVLEHGRAQSSLERSFRTPLAFGQAPLGGAIREGTPVAVLEIPRLGVREVVVEGTTSAQLKKGPGHLRTSPLPGQRGNAVIAGRRLAYSGPFLHLDRLRRGTQIRVITGQGRSVYVVQGSRVVSPHHADPIGPTRESRLTLVTSDPPLLANRRLVITASLTGTPRPAPVGRTNELNRDELGLQGEPGAVVPLLLWGELLLLAGAVAALLYRRWPRWPAYLVCTPVILLLVVLVFDSFAGLLPATL
jgi:sortase A